ncbi:MAG: substrate-binding domain-containing protein, partial [Chloroflexi bacterium]|nr:substrate-binding domain-containing protein [Chloroflexota bacterium]
MIVVAGESLIDLLVREDGSVRATPGGGPYNVARALGRLGRPVAFLGRISTDRFGRILRERLVADGVGLTMAPTTDDPTLLAVAELDAGGSAGYRFHTTGTAAVGLVPGDLPAGLPATTTVLHVGTLGLVLQPMAATIEQLVARAGSDVLVMADPNCRPSAISDEPAYRARLGRVLARIDVVKVSTDDLAWLEPALDVVAAARVLVSAGPPTVLVTDGGRPVRIVTAGAVTAVDVPRVVVVDSVGAGDAFGAGFLAAWTAAGHGRAIVNYAASSTLARQIEHGARADLYITADPDWLDRLVSRGEISAGSRRSLCANRLVVIAPARRGFPLRFVESFAAAAA